MSNCSAPEGQVWLDADGWIPILESNQIRYPGASCGVGAAGGAVRTRPLEECEVLMRRVTRVFSGAVMCLVALTVTTLPSASAHPGPQHRDRSTACQTCNGTSGGDASNLARAAVSGSGGLPVGAVVGNRTAGPKSRSDRYVRATGPGLDRPTLLALVTVGPLVALMLFLIKIVARRRLRLRGRLMPPTPSDDPGVGYGTSGQWPQAPWSSGSAPSQDPPAGGGGPGSG